MTRGIPAAVTCSSPLLATAKAEHEADTRLADHLDHLAAGETGTASEALGDLAQKVRTGILSVGDIDGG